ncbi:dihydrofolate reductase-like domain containing protein [Nitzschia inconspicua]|uniref:Dihydrofolate reductase-like domain containing protein n=1 Tax=Nitzschia inconspicua TaxID=303405 RepID=A0A9K3KEZ0_9STRA|nr:dihydrofolate reductase-like domain containing protein [Nitzschia inconspicua]
MASESFDSTNRSLKGCVNIALSVDGFIAGKDGDLDWLNNHPPATDDDSGDMGFAEFLARIDVIIMGRNTFDVVVGFGKDIWPYGELPILVWTSDVSNVYIPDWIRDKNSVTAWPASSPQDLWNELESRENYKKAYIDGGETIQSFLEAGLVHEFSLTRVPILLGEGIALFSSKDSTRRKLIHISTKSFDNGMVTSKYMIEDV